jgi:hypothetical protein
MKPIIPFLSIIIMLLSNSCCGYISFSPPPAYPQHSFSIDDLFLNKNDLPKGWETEGNAPFDTCKAAPLGSGCNLYYAKALGYLNTTINGRIFQETFRYHSSKEPEKDYERMKKEDVFYVRPSDSEWSLPKELENFRLKAKRFDIACNRQFDSPNCSVIALYQEFIVTLNYTPIDYGGNHSQFIQFIETVDNKITNLTQVATLESNNPVP